jgi:hypothetical protein
MFGLYAVLGLLALVLYGPPSPAVEIADEAPKAPLQQSKMLVYGMAALFGMDSFGTGFLVQSLLALWLYQAFQVSVTTTATILFWTGICSAISYLVAVPIAERIGLIKTMVFTHSAVKHFTGPRALRAQSWDRNRPVARAQRAVSDGRADSRLLRNGRRSARRAAGRREHHGGAEDLRLGGRLNNLGLSAHALHLWLAVAYRRRHQGRLRHPAVDQISESASA